MISPKPDDRPGLIQRLGSVAISNPSTVPPVEIECSPVLTTINERNELAYTRKRTELMKIASTLHGSRFSDPSLDPTSPDFDAYQWAKMVLEVANKAGVKFRRASFSFRNLTVSGSSSGSHFQPNVASVLMAPFRITEYISFGKKPETTILNHFDGVIKSGEMLLVLGRPGSGCSTFLKTVAGELQGLKVDKDSVVDYNGMALLLNDFRIFSHGQQGISQDKMIQKYKGELVYNSEVDRHFPHLTVGQTLQFAATMSTPRNHVLAVSRKENASQLTAVAMAICGLAHTKNTKVGNDFVRGVSGGERKVIVNRG
jgi:ATP-binding cassette, subfamily G (WHITE), member 2, PDR